MIETRFHDLFQTFNVKVVVEFPGGRTTMVVPAPAVKE
jgi:hypothetical protein